MRDERLVGIMRETSFHLGPVDDFERRLVEVGHHTARPVIESAVPDAAARPRLEFGLAYGDRTRAVPYHGARGHAAG